MPDKPNNTDRGLTDRDWDDLLYRISKRKCTPFLGAGVNHGILPLGAGLAGKLAAEFDCPLPDNSDLAKVAQYVALERDDPVRAKESVLDILNDELEEKEKAVKISDRLNNPEHPLSVLADLPFSIYMTTNYDDLMFRALDLEARQKKPRREFCRWSRTLRSESDPSVLNSDSDFAPEPATPLVFHLHGYDEQETSLVLTEDDYLDFLVNLSRDQDLLLPPRIQRAITGTSLLFIGYGLEDWDFRVLFHGLVDPMEKGLRRKSVAVQLDVEGEMKEHLIKYFDNLHIGVYWGTAQEFVAELRERWQDYRKKLEARKEK
ncbi:SIR2 family protein [Candidatus Poribacteria bacterium]